MKVIITENYEEMINVLTDIVSEEHVHIGQLTEIMKLVSPNVEEQDKGREEANDQLEEPVKVEKEISIDRVGISKIIFSDESMREKLNALVHPYVVKRIFETIKAEKKELAFVEVPLLFEGKLQNLFDKIIVVFRPLEERLKALKNRGLSPKESKNRIDSQVDYDRISKKDVISLYNDSDITSLENKVKDIINQVVKR